MNFSPLRACMQDIWHKGIPGLELIVCQDHRILFHECVGYSDFESKRPASPKDLYWLYSCTKPVTAAAAMLAMEQGLFQLDAPVGDYLSAYQQVYLKKAGVWRKPKQPVTIRHLLTMTAGLDYNLDRPAIRKAQAEGRGLASTAQIAEALAEEPLCYEPGERFQYSLCLDVLGAVIERTSGMSLQDYMSKFFFVPLGMNDTSFCTGALPERLAAKYWYSSKEKRVLPGEPTNRFVLSRNFYGGGAGLMSTALDLIRFTDALACEGIGENGCRILQKESIDLMRSEQLSSFKADDGFTCTCGADYGYGLGVRTRIAFSQGEFSAPGEFGWDGAAGADMLIDPENRLSMVYMQHVMNWPALLGAHHLALRDSLYRSLRMG